jgi:2',3'-cyclic-nucleotide 2'-phosphodiesterase/3'-nucleotidase
LPYTYLAKKYRGGVTLTGRTILGRVIVIFIIIALLVGSTVALAAEADGRYVTVDVLAVNDFHGALTPGRGTPGASALAGFLKAEMAKNQTGTLLLSAGDMLQGSIESNLLRGKPVIEMMNTIGFTAMAFGNHEFDWGIDVLKERINQAKFPLLASNVFAKNSGEPADFTKPYIIIKIDGIKIGIIGVITPETTVTTNPAVVAGLRFADPLAVLPETVASLRRQGADVIIVVGHIASYIDKAGNVSGDAARVAEAVPGIDAIVSGHSHQAVAGKVKGVPIVQAAYNGKAVGRIQLIFDRDLGRVTNSTVLVADLSEVSSPHNLQVEKIVNQARAQIAPLKDVSIGYAVKPLPHNRYELSPLGQWTTDVMRKAVKADIAVQNGGGLRTGISAGVVTVGTLYEVLPFDNNIYLLQMTGSQIKAVLEYGIDNKTFGMVQFSGLKVEYDGGRPEGQRIVSVYLSDGTELDYTKIYSVATNDFLVAGGDGFNMFKEAVRAEDTYILLRDALAEALRKAGRLEYEADDRLIHSLNSSLAFLAA